MIQRLICKIEDSLGHVLLVCFLGSHRYHLSIESSDADIMVVFSANADRLTKLDWCALDDLQEKEEWKPDQHAGSQTIRNPEHVKPDLMIIEVEQFCR